MPNTERVKEIKKEISNLKKEMRANGIRQISFMNAGLSSEERYYNTQLFKLKTELINAEKESNPKRVKNFWPFDRFSTIERPSVKRTTNLRYKGYAIYRDEEGNYLVPEIDRESYFEDKRQAKRFVDAEVRMRRMNPTGPSKKDLDDNYETVYPGTIFYDRAEAVAFAKSNFGKLYYIRKRGNAHIVFQLVPKKPFASNPQSMKHHVLNIPNPAPWFQRCVEGVQSWEVETLMEGLP